jgi:hypothetical protein
MSGLRAFRPAAVICALACFLYVVVNPLGEPEPRFIFPWLYGAGTFGFAIGVDPVARENVDDRILMLFVAGFFALGLSGISVAVGYIAGWLLYFNVLLEIFR